jgi:tetratricopeptide (TPR) repeat protein
VPFWRKKPYDRTQILASADRARAQGRLKKAIQGYRKVLEVDPSDHVVHGKLAPLLARKRRRGEALASFELAAQGQLKAGFSDRALAVYVHATSFFPEEPALWEEIARLEQIRGRRADAVRALIEGGGHLARNAQLRPIGVRLLKGALDIEPWHPEATMALARLLTQEKEREEALALLEDLAQRARGAARRRALGAVFRLAPTPGSAWRWLRAAIRGR